ncbi:uncharacterized protein ddias [Mastacembelus armatus]|uniref:DNA damage-induced apoptosis suppressor n=1 Tax=Mastacembelus armatus TaxID=205130 RepID=A0A3Q3ND23_9TELE|nr:DNA damage-induced apoptosis suppressor protein [Mastacembelus armatus]
MSAGRALVDCAVLSLQDTCVFYPCCQCCFSRIDVEQRDTLRCRCSRCGYSCAREQVEYRYRLALRVARDKCIFGVTVFGTCLNPFFGIPASGLQRLVHSVDGPVGAATRSTLLAKAVEDCFIGRHFIFGIKVTGKESGLWLGGHAANEYSNKSRVQFIASQMILPIATGLGGCSVVSYYQALLQKTAECELGSTDPRKTGRAPATSLILIPHRTPAGSFSNTTLSASGFLSLQSSQHQDCSLAPTPPWQQSLGLVTSSAEQEEGYSTQDSADENNTQAENNKTPHDAQMGCLENCKVTEARTMSPLSLEQRSYYSLSFDTYQYSSTEKPVVNNPILNTWASPSQPGLKNDLPLSFKTNEFTSRQPTTTFLSSSLAWDDLPFSESLTDFLCEADKNFDGATEPHLNVPDHKETARKNLEIRSQTKTLSTESTSACQSSTQEAESHSRTVLDVTNSSPPDNTGDTHDSSEQVCKNPVRCINRSQGRAICSHECNQDDEEACSFENEAEQLEDNTYDCSADLFSSSLTMDMNTEMLNTHAETARVAAEACPPLSIPDKQHQRSDGTKVQHSAPDKLKVKSIKCINGDSLFPPVTLDLDFIPPSQSTPSVKLAVVSAKVTTSLCTLNSVSAHQLSRRSIKSTKENLLWNTTTNKCCHGFTKILCKEEQDYDSVSETEAHKNMQIQKGTARKKLKIRSQDENLSTASTCVCQSSTQEAESHSRVLLDVTNSHAPNNTGDPHDLSDQVCKNPVRYTNRSQDRTICSHECNQDDEETSSQCFNNEKEQLENNTYDCSADIFSSSLMMHMNTHAESARLTAEANVQHSTPDNLKITSKKCINRDSLIPPVTLDLDFIPPSQSTPIVKLAVVPAKITPSVCILNTNQLSQCGRESIKKNLVWKTTSSNHCHRLTPKRTFWKPEKLRVQRGAVSLESAVRIKNKCDSSVCDFKDKDISPIVATEKRLSVKLRRRHTDNSSSHLDSTQEGCQGGGVKCKRTLLHPTLTPSQTAVAQTGNCDSEMAVKGILDGSNGYFLDNENQASDWSRDLFSDSF